MKKWRLYDWENESSWERRFPYFWQDSNGKEIDCLLVDGEEIFPIEIKSGKTVSESYCANLKVWQKLTGSEQHGAVVYGGERTLQTSSGKLVSWRDLDKIS